MHPLKQNAPTKGNRPPPPPIQGMRDLGLEQLGAQLSLFGRQVASSIGALLPAELNPFGPDEDVRMSVCHCHGCPVPAAA